MTKDCKVAKERRNAIESSPRQKLITIIIITNITIQISADLLQSFKKLLIWKN